MFFFCWEIASFELNVNKISEYSFREIEEENEINNFEVKIFDKIYKIYITRTCIHVCLNPHDPINYYEDVEHIEWKIKSEEYKYWVEFRDKPNSHYLKLKEEYENKFVTKEYLLEDRNYYLENKPLYTQGGKYSMTTIFPLYYNPVIVFYSSYSTKCLKFYILVEKENKIFTNLKKNPLLEWNVFDIIEDFIRNIRN
jgi:hypothetical protein